VSETVCVPFVQKFVVLDDVLPPSSTLSVVTVYVVEVVCEFPAKSVAVQL